MNRQMKRMQERQERAQKRAGTARPATPSAATRKAAVQENDANGPARASS